MNDWDKILIHTVQYVHLLHFLPQWYILKNEWLVTWVRTPQQQNAAFEMRVCCKFARCIWKWLLCVAEIEAAVHCVLVNWWPGVVFRMLCLEQWRRKSGQARFLWSEWVTLLCCALEQFGRTAIAVSLISLLAQQYTLTGVPIAIVSAIACTSNGCDKLILACRTLDFAL